MFFFNTWSNTIYSLKFITIGILLISSIIIISYILAKAIIKGIKEYQKKEETINKIISINKDNVIQILKELNLESSYKLKLKNLNNINELKSLLLKKYHEK